MVLLDPVTPTASEATLGLYLEPSVLSSPVKKKVLLNEPPKECYEVQSIPSKGMGLFATSDIKKGDLILRESPLILMPKRIFDDDDPDYIEQWLDRRINRLTSEEREIFYSLADSRFFDGENKTSLGIFYTNDMTFTDDDAALFPTMARANHSCTPNADFIARDELGVQDLVAVHPISKGDEITLCYLPSSSSGSEIKKLRQKYTRKWYGFQCSCQACCRKGLSLKNDDEIRNKIRTYQSIDFDELTLNEVEDLIDQLRKIDTKLPYLIDVCEKTYNRAIASNDLVLASKVASIGFMSSEIIDEIDGSVERNHFKFILESRVVKVGNESFLFHI